MDAWASIASSDSVREGRVMGTQNLHSTLPLSVQASLLLSALRASPMGSTSLRPPFDDRDYVPSLRPHAERSTSSESIAEGHASREAA